MSDSSARRAVLEVPASPDQLDQTIQVASPLYWTSLAAILVALAAAGVWSATGSIPTKATGEGTVIRPGGVFNVAAGGSGFITTLKVRAGAHVSAGEVIAEIDQPSTDDDIRALEAHLAELRDQTEESVELREDTAAMQNKSLDVRRKNAQQEIVEQQKMEKIATEELATNQQLQARGLITRQPVIEAQQRLIAVQSNINRLNAEINQTESQAFESNWQPGEMKKQRALEIHDLEARLTGMRRRSRITSTAIAPVSGEVVEEKAYPGALVAAGAPIVSIEPDSDEVITVVYVPSTQAKEIKAGMAAEVSPSTAKREEFGFIPGKVTYVAHFPATTSAMMTLFENDSMVAALQARGMVTEVDIAMERSKDTPSGFRWSSSRGPETQVAAGTLCSAQVITRSQKPIEFVFPFLRRISGLH